MAPRFPVVAGRRCAVRVVRHTREWVSCRLAPLGWVANSWSLAAALHAPVVRAANTLAWVVRVADRWTWAAQVADRWALALPAA